MQLNKNFCRSFDTEIWLYISGEMPADQKSLWHRHIEECPECSTNYKELFDSLESYQKIPLANPDEMKTEKILRKISRRPYQRWKKISAVCTGIAATILLGILLTRGPNNPEVYSWDTEILDRKIFEISAELQLRQENHWPWPVVSEPVNSSFEEQIIQINNQLDMLKIEKNGGSL